MPEAFNLRRMLQEIAEDEKISTSKRAKVSQADIQKMLKERRRNRRESAVEAESTDSSGTSPSAPVERMEKGKGGLPYPEGPRGNQADPGGDMDRPPAEKAPHDRRVLHSEHPSVPGVGRPILQISDGVLPARIILKYRVIPLRVGERVLELAMEDPDDLSVIYDVEVLTGRRVEPVRVEREVLERSLRLFQVDGTEVPDSAPRLDPDESHLLRNLLEVLVVSEASDLLIAQGSSPWLKTPAHMESTGLPAVTALDCVRLAKSLMNEERWERFLTDGVVSFSHQDLVHGLFRVQVFRERGAPSLVIRRCLNPLPTIEELGLPSWVEELALSESGLVIVSGPSGHGKTTTLHAMIHEINRQKTCHVVAIEDPVEFLHRSLKSQIIQRELGRDVRSGREGIRQAMQQGAHVIVLGELSSAGVFLQALAAAESGRLVLTTLDSSSPSGCLDQLIHTVPKALHSQILSMAENTELVVVAQKLLVQGIGYRMHPQCQRVDARPEMQKLLKTP